MLQPLVTRPAESKLPEGSPARKGLPLDDEIPGQKTFAKPVDDVREPENRDESICRVDGPDDMTKDQKSTPPEERDHSRFKPRYAPPGKDVTPKTKYPYRDGYPNTHNAMVEFVAGMWLLRDVRGERVDFAALKAAARLSEIRDGLDPQIERKADACEVVLKRADVRNLRWIFSVDCGSGAKVVKMRADRPTPRIKDMSKMDVSFACSCPAWQWRGPEYHAQQGGYLLGKPRGTATMPVVRDPEQTHRVCKHVAAVMSLVRKWQIPAK